MLPARLVIPRTVLDQVLAHARACLPDECCGLLGGNVGGEVSAWHAVRNTLASPTAFRTDPRDLLTAFKAMRATDTELLAVVHSHPTSPAVPSRRDLAENTYGAVAWVIVGLRDATPDVRAWRLGAETFAELDLVVA